MTEISSARTICGIGSILMLLIFIPFIGVLFFAFFIAGVIFVAIGIKQISDTLKREYIYRNYLMYLALYVTAIAMTYIIGFVVAWIIFILSSLFYKKSFDEIAKTFNIILFSITAIIYLIGSILTIIGIGFIIICIAIILQTISFFMLPEKIEIKTPSQQISLV